jgi:hypothetical protein
VVSSLNDPNFGTSCAGQAANCNDAWGLRVVSSQNVLVYGAGFYSFFNNYDGSKLFTPISPPSVVYNDTDAYILLNSLQRRRRAGELPAKHCQSRRFTEKRRLLLFEHRWDHQHAHGEWRVQSSLQ